jgi:AcrR family transcriptional regulator
MAKGKNRLTGEERRQLIIKNAAAVFAVHGLDGARTKDLAEECGINESLIYKHFASKEQLYKEAMAYMHDGMVDTWRVFSLNQPDSVNAIRDTLEKSCSFYAQNPQLAANMLHGVAVTTRAPEMATQAREWFIGYRKFIHSLLEKGIKEGSIVPYLDIEAAATCLMGVGWMCAISEVIHMDEIHENMDAARMVTFILHAPPESIQKKCDGEADSQAGDSSDTMKPSAL